MQQKLQTVSLFQYLSIWFSLSHMKLEHAECVTQLGLDPTEPTNHPNQAKTHAKSVEEEALDASGWSFISHRYSIVITSRCIKWSVSSLLFSNVEPMFFSFSLTIGKMRLRKSFVFLIVMNRSSFYDLRNISI